MNSIATSLAVFWGTDIYSQVRDKARAEGMSSEDHVAERATPEQPFAVAGHGLGQAGQQFR